MQIKYIMTILHVRHRYENAIHGDDFIDQQINKFNEFNIIKTAASACRHAFRESRVKMGALRQARQRMQNSQSQVKYFMK
jgi:hypothetical protein